MKYVNPLSLAERITLQEMYKHGPSHRVRQRAHMLLMSNKHLSLELIATVCQLDRDTVSSVINRWERYGIVGLYDYPRSGRPQIFSDQESVKILLKLSNEPRNLKTLAVEMMHETEKSCCPETIKRIIKKAGMRWKRIRKKVSGEPDAEEYQKKRAIIATLKQRSVAGDINLYFGDESGFSLTPSVSYAWQPTGETIAVSSSRSAQINVLGFLSYHNDMKSITLNGSVDADCIIAAIEHLFSTVEKETWLVLDNAPIHRSHKFKRKMSEWKKQNLNILFLPTYSPELNPIEIVWRFMKYHWLPFSAYTGFKKLTDAVNHILENYGKKYLITFV